MYGNQGNTCRKKEPVYFKYLSYRQTKNAVLLTGPFEPTDVQCTLVQLCLAPFKDLKGKIL